MGEFGRCLKLGRLVRFQASSGMVENELLAARDDLDSALASRQLGNAKWASIQAYYSMFHCAKALVLAKGYREKGHLCLLVALRQLYVRTGEMDEGISLAISRWPWTSGTRPTMASSTAPVELGSPSRWRRECSR